jgi:predicted membrane channel-forming protein YqfA (hemolysin III family)
MYRPVFAIAGCVAVVVVGLLLVTVAPSLAGLGAVITVAGLALLVAYLAGVLFYAWRGDQKRALDPGSLVREWREEEAAKRK